MKNIFNLFVFALVLVMFNGCSETEITVPRVTEIISDRVVLIEDFTGVKCPNCPNASREISTLSDKYPKNIVAVAYHTNFLGDPITKEGYQSKYDFRTADGEKLETEMGSYLGKPAVALNRKLYDPLQEYLLTSTSVFGNIENELKSIPKAKIVLDNTYEPGTRRLTCRVTVEPQAAVSGDFRLHVLITESNIIDSQEDNLVYVRDYNHKHVFRTMLSALAGDPIGSALTPGTNVSKTYEFTLPPEEGWWVAHNCNVVVFITDLTQKAFNVGAVLQAAEAHVVE